MFGIKRQREKKTHASATAWTAFEAEALPHMGDLFRIAMWMCGERAAAEDLLQETYTQALQSFHRYELKTNCRAWLVKIMYHVNGKRRRANARLRLVNDDEERIAETIASNPPTPQHITEEEVLQALRKIPSQFQEVILLADIEDMAYREIAESLEIPVGTVMSRLARGRKLLRAGLASYARARGIGSSEDTPEQKSLATKQQGGASDAMS